MAEIGEAVQPLPVPHARTFFGEPRALAFLTFTEAWERFSYYGMTALLVLYMSQALLLPGHVEHVAGFAAFRSGLEAVFGRLSTLSLASQIFGLYSGFVYFTPVFGGWIADKWLGRRNGVMLGAVLMSAGQIAMAFDVSFLAALLLLIVGCGFLKGNISAQVGALYSEADGAGRTRAYSIYSMGINVGAVAGPILCGLLAQLYGWHAGFALAGLLMLLGLLTYVLGYSSLPDSPPGGSMQVAAAPLTAHEWRTIAGLVIVMALTVFESIGQYQSFNANLIWIDRNVDLDLPGFRMPVAWFSAIVSFSSIVFVPVLFALWRFQSTRGGEPGEIAKIATGAWITAAANLLLVSASFLHARVPALVPIVYDVLLGIGFLYYWPTLLALVSRAAPAGLKSTLMGCAFLSLFASNILLGWIGTFYERMTPASFWALHACIAATGGILAMLLAKPLGRLLDAKRAP